MAHAVESARRQQRCIDAVVGGKTRLHMLGADAFAARLVGATGEAVGDAECVMKCVLIQTEQRGAGGRGAVVSQQRCVNPAAVDKIQGGGDTEAAGDLDAEQHGLQQRPGIIDAAILRGGQRRRAVSRHR